MSSVESAREIRAVLLIGDIPVQLDAKLQVPSGQRDRIAAGQVGVKSFFEIPAAVVREYLDKRHRPVLRVVTEPVRVHVWPGHSGPPPAVSELCPPRTTPKPRRPERTPFPHDPLQEGMSRPVDVHDKIAVLIGDSSVKIWRVVGSRYLYCENRLPYALSDSRRTVGVGQMTRNPCGLGQPGPYHGKRHRFRFLLQSQQEEDLPALSETLAHIVSLTYPDRVFFVLGGIVQVEEGASGEFISRIVRAVPVAVDDGADQNLPAGSAVHGKGYRLASLENGVSLVVNLDPRDTESRSGNRHRNEDA